MNEQEIIESLKKGDHFVFNEIVEQRQEMVFNTVLSIVQNDEDADDITQEVFITLYERIRDFNEASTLSTWLYKITIRKALDHEKKKKRKKHGGFINKIFSVKEEEEPANFDHPGVLLDNKERAAVLFKALSKLPEKQRIAFTLHKMEGLSYRQISAIMNTSLFAIESLQGRAKTNLSKILNSYYRELY